MCVSPFYLDMTINNLIDDYVQQRPSAIVGYNIMYLL